MELTSDEAFELAKMCKKYYKADYKMSDHFRDDYFQDSDEAWEDEAYKLEGKRLKAKAKLEKHLKKLLDSKTQND